MRKVEPRDLTLRDALVKIYKKKFGFRGSLYGDEIESAINLAFAKAVRVYKEKRGQFSTLLYKISYHECVLALKRATKMRRVSDFPDEEGSALRYDGSTSVTIDNGEDLDKDIQLNMMHARLALLPEKQRYAIQQHYLQERTLESVGVDMKISKERVRQLCKEGLTTIRKKILEGVCL